MKILGTIVLIWLICLAIGAGFGILGKIVWLAILLSAIAAVYGFIKRE